MLRALSVIWLASLTFACGGKVERDPSAAADLAAPVPPANGRTILSQCRALARPAPPVARLETGAPLWLRELEVGEPVSGAAIDSEGNLSLARGGERLDQLDHDGRLRWSKPFGALVATDPQGSVYVAGALTRELDLPGASLRPADGNAYVVKLSAAGEPVYALALRASAEASVLDLAVSASSLAVVSGSGLGTVALDQAGRVRWRDEHFGYVAFDACDSAYLAGNLSDTELFVSKRGPGGEPQFFSRFSGAWGRAQAIAVDERNDVLVGGVFDAWLDLGQGRLTLDAAACTSDAWCERSGFLLELDPSGRTLWSRSLGPLRTLAGLASAARDRLLVSATLPGGATPFEIPLLLKLDGGGDEIWRRSEWPASGIGAGHDVLLDPYDNVLWSVSALPAPGGDERPFIAELSP